MCLFIYLADYYWRWWQHKRGPAGPLQMFTMHSYIICTFTRILSGFHLQPSHFHPIFPDLILCGVSPGGKFAFLSFVYPSPVTTSGLSLGDEIIDSMLFDQTFDKHQFMPLDFSLATSWWDSRETGSGDAADEINRWAVRNTVSPAPVLFNGSTSNSQEWNSPHGRPPCVLGISRFKQFEVELKVRGCYYLTTVNIPWRLFFLISVCFLWPTFCDFQELFCLSPVVGSTQCKVVWSLLRDEDELFLWAESCFTCWTEDP